MADLSTVYTLNCGGGGTILFNSGTLFQGSTDDLFWIATIRGLDGPNGRVPFDNVPFGDGGLIHRSFKGPRRPRFEGSLIVQSVDWGSSLCQQALNAMEEDLNTALDSIFAPTSGTLSWTPAGGAAKSLTVFYDAAEAPLDIQPTDNYALRSFTFGLISAAADPS